MGNVLFPSALGHPHAFTPAWSEKKNPKPVFWLRTASFAERSQYMADIEAHCGREVFQFQKDKAFEDFLTLILPDRDDQPDNAQQRERLLEILSQVRAGEAVSNDERLYLDKVWAIAAQTSPVLQELTQREALRNEMSPGLALIHFCNGLDNVTSAFGDPVTFVADARGRMSEKTLLALDPNDVWLVGQRAHNLQWGKSAEKNSSAPLKSGATT